MSLADAYAATKSAIANFTQSLAQELARTVAKSGRIATLWSDVQYVVPLQGTERVTDSSMSSDQLRTSTIVTITGSTTQPFGPRSRRDP